MEVVAFVFAIIAFGVAAASASKVKLLQKQIELIKSRINFRELDMLSPTTRQLILKADRDEAILAIRKELGISREDAEGLMERIIRESDA